MLRMLQKIPLCSQLFSSAVGGSTRHARDILGGNMRTTLAIALLTTVATASISDSAPAQVLTAAQCRMLAEAAGNSIAPMEKLSNSAASAAVLLAMLANRLPANSKISGEKLLRAEAQVVVATKSYVTAAREFRGRLQECGP
jgi:hypothetical protein